MARTQILPASVMNLRPHSTLLGLNWTQLSGSGSFAAAAPDGSLWVLSNQPAGPDKYIWHYVNGTWTNISGLATRLAVGQNGTLYAINSGGGAFSYSGGTWTALGGGCSDITAAADGSVYALSNGNAAGSDQAIWHYTSTWSQVAGAGIRIADSWDPRILITSVGTVSATGFYVINSIGKIYHANTDGSFVVFPDNGSAIAPTTIGGFFIFAYPSAASGSNIYWFDLDAPGFTLQTGSGVSISTDSLTLYVVAASGGIFSTPIAFGKVIASPTSLNSLVAGGSNGTINVSEANYSGVFNVSGNGSLASVSCSPASCAPSRAGGTVTINVTPNSRGSGTLTISDTHSGSASVPFAIVAIAEFSNGISSNAFPRFITAGPDGNVWFAEDSSNSVARITPSGTVTEFTNGISPSSHPYGITAGPDGNLWFTELSGRVARITTSGTVTEFAINGGGQEITAGPDGNLWFIVSQHIGRITPTGTVTDFSSGISPNSNPGGITAGPDGNLWFTEYSLDRIGRITTSGTVTEFSSGITAGSAPEGITSGPDGNLWFTENSRNSIGRITPSGTVTEFSAGITANSFPQFIVAGSDGNLWFTESGATRIARITTSGVVTEFSGNITGATNEITAGPGGTVWFTETTGKKVGSVQP
jgi:virginiamycin B lyase